MWRCWPPRRRCGGAAPPELASQPPPDQDLETGASANPALSPRGSDGIAVRLSESSELALALARREFVEASAAKLDDDIVIGRSPAALRISLLLAALGGSKERAICAEDHIAPVVPVPPRLLEPRKRIADAPDASRARRLRSLTALDNASPRLLPAIGPHSLGRAAAAIAPFLRRPGARRKQE